MTRHLGVSRLSLVGLLLLSLTTVPHADASSCSGWSVDRNRLGTPERDHGSLRIMTTEGVWKWEYSGGKLLEFYAVAVKAPDEQSREKKLEKFKKRFITKHGQPSPEDPYEKATERHLQNFLVADPHGNGTDRWLDEVSPDGVWFSEDCNAHISLFRGSRGGEYYVLVLLRPVGPPEK